MVVVIGGATLEWWSLYKDFISGVGHSGSNSVRLLMMDDRV
jgi:hypothetical protein